MSRQRVCLLVPTDGAGGWLDKQRSGCFIFLRGRGREVCRWGRVSGWAAWGVVAVTYNPRPPNTHKSFTLTNSIWPENSIKRNALLTPIPLPCHQTENIFHLILLGFMSSSPPCSDYAVTSLKSLVKDKKHLFKPILSSINPVRTSM